MRRFVVVTMSFAICTVVGVAAWRLSVDALALIIGVGLGFVLMLPVGGVLVWMVRSNAKALQDQVRSSVPQSPPVIVVQPASQPALRHDPAPHQIQSPTLLPPPGYPVDLSATSRNWALRVFGDEQFSEPQETLLEHPQWRR